MSRAAPSDFEREWRAAWPMLQRYIRRLCAYSRIDPEDLAQQTALRCLIKFRQFDHETNFVKWATCVAHSLFITEVRSVDYQKRVSQDPQVMAGRDANLPDVEQAIIAREQIRMLDANMADDRVRIGVQYAITGAEYPQLAREFNIEEGTVRSRMGRFREEWRDKLGRAPGRIRIDHGMPRRHKRALTNKAMA